MAITERRASPRFRVALKVRFKNRAEEIDAETYSIGRHGVFVLTPHVREPGELMQLIITLPPGAVGSQSKLPVTLKMVAVVAWRLTHEEATARDRKPGNGFKFYMLSARDKDLWDQYIERLELDGPVVAPLSTDEPVVPRKDVYAGPVRYLLRARNLDALHRFGQQELMEGCTFLKTPLVRAVQERVELVLIHPDSEQEFILPAIVRRAVGSGPVTARGLELQYLEPLGGLRERFAHFVKHGQVGAYGHHTHTGQGLASPKNEDQLMVM